MGGAGRKLEVASSGGAIRKGETGGRGHARAAEHSTGYALGGIREEVGRGHLRLPGPEAQQPDQGTDKVVPE